MLKAAALKRVLAKAVCVALAFELVVAGCAPELETSPLHPADAAKGSQRRDRPARFAGLGEHTLWIACSSPTNVLKLKDERRDLKAGDADARRSFEHDDFRCSIADSLSLLIPSPDGLDELSGIPPPAQPV